MPPGCTVDPRRAPKRQAAGLRGRGRRAGRRELAADRAIVGVNRRTGLASRLLDVNGRDAGAGVHEPRIGEADGPADEELEDAGEGGQRPPDYRCA